jgi:hypothetical protein
MMSMGTQLASDHEPVRQRPLLCILFYMQGSSAHCASVKCREHLRLLTIHCTH